MGGYGAEFELDWYWKYICVVLVMGLSEVPAVESGINRVADREAKVVATSN